MAHRLELPGRDDPQQDVLQLVYRWLANEENGPWLMVVDNADDGDILSRPFPASPTASDCLRLPKTGRGAVLATSRSWEVAEGLVGANAICQVLLRARLGTRHEDGDAASRLLVALDHLPLAIIQAASYIKRRSVRRATIASYLDEFRSNAGRDS